MPCLHRYIWTSQNSSTLLSPCINHFWFTQACWQVAGQLQLKCLSRLNPWFIPCVCAFTYLPSSIIFTADMSIAPAVKYHICEHVNIPKNMEHFRAYIDSGHTVLAVAMSVEVSMTQTIHTQTQQELLTIQKAQYLYTNIQRVLKRKQVKHVYYLLFSHQWHTTTQPMTQYSTVHKQVVTHNTNTRK